MFNRDKPLFSRPVLAVIIVLSTLAVWLLNLTDPKVELESPTVESWQTSSDIPVHWISQASWQGGDKVVLSIVLQSDTTTPQLTAATLENLTGPTLPLSTASINQRLASVAAVAETHYTPQQQTISVTFSNRPQYLKATFNTLQTWLNNTQFKESAIQNWRRYQQQDLGQQQLLLQLLSFQDLAVSEQRELSASALQSHFNTLKQRVSHILISGDLDEYAQSTLAQALNGLTSSMKASPSEQTWQLAKSPATSTIGDQSLQAIYGAIGVQPLTSVKDWLALQIWAKDTLQAQKDALNSQTGQWHLDLAKQPNYVSWRIQIPQSVLQSDADSEEVQTSWITPETLNSYQSKPVFNTLKDELLQQLLSLSQNPNWWQAVATDVALPNGSLSLQAFAKDYSEAANSFTIEEYQQRLKQLLIPSSRQEVLIKL